VPTTLIPSGRWVPIDVWLLAAQEHQRADYGTGHESIAEVLAAPAVPYAGPPRGAAARRRARKSLTSSDAA
jgi:hypothetical protein